MSPETKTYWENRKAGKRGQGEQPVVVKFLKAAPDITMGFDNSGKMIAKTRAIRRQKPPTDNQYTRATHSIKKARKQK